MLQCYNGTIRRSHLLLFISRSLLHSHKHNALMSDKWTQHSITDAETTARRHMAQLTPTQTQSSFKTSKIPKPTCHSSLARTAHMSALMIEHDRSTQYSTEQFWKSLLLLFRLSLQLTCSTSEEEAEIPTHEAREKSFLYLHKKEILQ